MKYHVVMRCYEMFLRDVMMQRRVIMRHYDATNEMIGVLGHDSAL